MNNDELNSTQKELIQEIELAFKDVELGEGISIHQANAADDWATEEVQLQMRQQDLGIRWQDLSDELLGGYPSIFSFLDEKGLRFYLPAYMRFAIKHPNETSSEMLLIHLKYERDRIQSFVKNAELDRSQCKAILNFLTYKKSEYLDSKNFPETLAAWNDEIQQH